VTPAILKTDRLAQNVLGQCRRQHDAAGCAFGCPQIEELPSEKQQLLAEVVEEGRFADGQHLVRKEEPLPASGDSAAELGFNDDACFCRPGWSGVGVS
jgi:hypothetical protein